MNDARYWTSLYVAGLPSGFVPPRAATRKAIWDHIRQLGCNTNMEVRDEEEKPALFFNGTLIDFRVNDAPRDGVYLLAFLPTGKNAPKWYKGDSQNAARNVLDFCDLLGSSLTVEILEETFAFKRESYVQSSVVDISEWEVVCPYGSPARKELLRDFISEIRATGYENVYRCIPQDSIFHVFTDTYINGGSPLTVLNKTLSDYGKIFGPRSLSIVKEFGEKLDKKEICAFIFLETGELLERCYRDLKIFFDSNNMPTQYVSVGTISDKIRYPGVKANLLLEILTKMDRPPIVLQAPEEMFINDGFLCLSDIESAARKLFGALFTYSRQGLNVRGEAQIYEDIEYEATSSFIDVQEESIDILGRKASALFGGRPLRIDVLLTKRWSQYKVQRLVSSLQKNEITVERAYHLSSRTCRFVDEYLERNARSLRHPYLIVGPKTGFLRTSTEIRLYPHLFSDYVELVWPEDEELRRGDLEKILWLVKKRIYRIQEFHVLKRTEPISIFNSMRKMYLGEIRERLTIPLRLLI